MPYGNSLFHKLIILLIVVCCIINCFAVFAQASTGFVEVSLTLVCQNPAGSTRYITSRAELEDYASFGSFKIKVSNGKCNDKGETYQAFFACYASHIEYADDGKIIPEVLSPTCTTTSFTADENTYELELVSEKPEYEKVTEFGGSAQYLWQIEADGDYNVIRTIGGAGFFSSMSQYY